MNPKLLFHFLVAVLFLGPVSATPVAAANPPEEVLFPFVLPWDDASPGPTDLSGRLHKPAGKHGFIRVGDDGHFYAGAERIRFFGVNMSFSGSMPPAEDAPKIAGRLAKFGVNVVRFHHMDTSAWPGGIRKRDTRSSGELDPEALARLDGFFARLKERGLYANINLLVGRPFNSADGLPAEMDKLDWKDRHILGFFDARQLALQKEYARALLLHRNPHTGLTYAEDPGVAFVEINNEQGLVHAWLGGHVDALPAVFQRDLQRQWNDWLRRRHGSTATLRAAWSTGEQPLGPELLVNADFRQSLNGWTLEQHAGAKATASVVADLPPDGPTMPQPPKAVRLQVAQPGPENWHVQFGQAGLKLEAGQSYTLRFWARADAARAVSVSASQAHEPWGNLGLSTTARLTNQWREFRFVFTASQSDRQARIVFSGLGPAGASVMLWAPSLRAGGVLGLKPDEDPRAGTVALFHKSHFGERTVAAQLDWMRFLEATEEAYWQAMTRFLKDELHVKALITGTIVGCTPPNLAANWNWVDTHAYWQHPHFPRRPWDPADWIVNNKTLVNERGGTLAGLARKRIVGKPHACTEYNHPAPNTYSSEGFLLLAAYAALQDWDAIYAYSYAHSGTGRDVRRINGFFDIDQHPTKMATLPAAVALFVRGDVRPARQLVVAELPREREVDLLRTARAWSLVDGGHVGLSAEATLVHRVALATEGRPVPAGTLRPEQVKITGPRFVSDTGELAWDLTEPKRGVVTVNTPRSKAVIGFGGGRRFALGDVVIEPGTGLQDGWSAITLTTADEPGRWLLTATGYADNTDMGWKNPEKSSVGRDWGRAPSRVEGVPAKLTFARAASAIEAWTLDERGQRKTRVPVQAGPDGQAVIELGPRWQTIWYEVRVK